uniref:NADH-ubiquinone oxidoreductase chain 2 n=1 Tax=Sperchon placodermus TaxID=3136837 RepID=A0AAU6QEE8_9ACAR
MMKWITLVMAPVGAISSSNWVMTWVFLEISSFSFIITSKKLSSSESMLKYFLIQTISSIIILSSISMKMMSPLLTNSLLTMTSSTMLIISLMVKGGLAPLHFWMMNISKSLSWKNLSALLTIQKLAPMTLILNSLKINMMMIIILMCSIIGTVSQLSSINMKMLMTYSSISHSSWMLLSGMVKTETFFIYMIIYTMIIIQIMNYLNKLNINFISSMEYDITLIILMMSLGGLPPLTGFFPKWMAISNIMESMNMKLTSILLMFMASVNIYIYMRIMTSTILKNPMKKTSKSKNINMMIITLSINLLIAPMFMLNNI